MDYHVINVDESQVATSSLVNGKEEGPSQPALPDIQGPDNSNEGGIVDKVVNLIKRNLASDGHAEGQSRVRISSTSIYQFPNNLKTGINRNFYEPELVSIGPYHKNTRHLLEFERYKKHFARRLLFLSTNNLETFVIKIKELEKKAKDCYFNVSISSDDFIEMMLVDGFFILDFLRYLKYVDCPDPDDPIFGKPWLISIIIKDLLQLENQLPYFVLSSLFELCGKFEGKYTLPQLAVNIFKEAPITPSTNYPHMNWQGKHLLDLYYSSLTHPLAQYEEGSDEHLKKLSAGPPVQPVPSVTQLQQSGIRFKPGQVNSNSLFCVSFQPPVLEVPTIAINDSAISMLMNCAALEQCEKKERKYITGYVSFMTCLISQPSDVACLCSDGIITDLSKDDKSMAYLSNMLAKNVIFDVRESYLSDHCRAINSYCSSKRVYIRRTYCSSPWAFISVFSATVLLLLTMTQSIMSVLSYKYN